MGWSVLNKKYLLFIRWQSANTTDYPYIFNVLRVLSSNKQGKAPQYLTS